MKHLLTSGADIHQRDRVCVIFRHSLPCISCVALPTRLQMGNSTFHVACADGDMKIVKLLLDFRADPHEINKVGFV